MCLPVSPDHGHDEGSISDKRWNIVAVMVQDPLFCLMATASCNLASHASFVSTLALGMLS